MSKLYSICRQYYFILLIILAVFIPLYPKFPLLNVSGTYVAIRLEDFLIGVFFLLWFFLNIPRLKVLLKENIYLAFLLFWAIGGLSLLSGFLITHSLSLHLGLLHWFRRVEYMSLFIMAATSLSSLKQVKWFVTTSVFTALAVVVYGFGQIWLDFPVISTTNKEFSKGLVLYLTNGARVNSTFAGHYDLAIYLSLVLALLAGMFLFYRKFIFRTLIIFFGALNFILLGFTASRISFVAALVGLAGVFWLSKKKLVVIGLIFSALLIVGLVPDLRHRLVATVTVNLMGGGGPKYSPPPGTVTIFTPKSSLPKESSPVALLSATKSGAIAVDTVPGEPINTTELGVYRSFGIRLNVEWPRAWGAFLKNPLLGTGYSSLTIATDNDILRSLGEVGLWGTLSLGLIFFIISKKMLLALKKGVKTEKTFAIVILCMIVVMFISATFIDVLEASKVGEFFWLVLGVGWAVVTNFGRRSDDETV
ncbi:MAG: O-antigen ligase family protein [bacterium]|nr:O-antigen ligase family protein [bacterium]